MDLRFLNLKNIRYFIERKLLPTTLPSDRGPRPPGTSIEELRKKYQQSGSISKPDTFVLCRIIGNDLPPRHKRGQSLSNLKFILENEPELPGCTKRFVVNRIVDPQEEQAIINILEQSGLGFTHLPFSEREYQSISWDISGIPTQCYPYTKKFATLSPLEQSQIMMRVYRLKNNYVMHNNGARNIALREGRKLAKWVLPWDGNCFVTSRAWAGITSAVTAQPEIPYHLVPMARVTDNSYLLDESYLPPASEEPQILFRCDAALEFDAEYPYGRRPKVELFWRLGVPGRWDSWVVEPWDLPCPAFAEEAGNFGTAGWVARLFSGEARLEKGIGTFGMRGLARSAAVVTFLDSLDNRISLERKQVHQPVYLPADLRREHETGSDEYQVLIEKLINEAELALLRGPYSVVDKRTLPPSGNKHDYWHPAPYFWPIIPGIPGLPYIRRDGKRVPGTRMYEPLSEKYDRTRLQRLFDDTFILSLAWHALGDIRYARHAALLVRRWFVDPESAMTPHLEYAQVRQGRSRNRGSSSGIIETKDFYFFLDALRILRGAEVLTSAEWSQLEEWFGRFLHWLRTSPQGRQERSSTNNHGTYYDLQIAAIASFLGNEQILRQTFLDSRFRLQQQIDADGRQPEEMKRTTTAHYCCFNIQGWIHLALLAEAIGEDLWNHANSQGPLLQKAMQWLLSNMDYNWPHKQIHEFDTERWYPIYYAYRAKYALPSELKNLNVPPRHLIKPLFDPHDGIRLFWQIVNKYDD